MPCPCATLGASPSVPLAVDALVRLLRGVQGTREEQQSTAPPHIGVSDLAKVLAVMSRCTVPVKHEGHTPPSITSRSPLVEAFAAAAWARRSCRSNVVMKQTDGAYIISIQELTWLFSPREDGDGLAPLPYEARRCVFVMCLLVGHDEPNWSGGLRYLLDVETGGPQHYVKKRRDNYWRDVPLDVLLSAVASPSVPPLTEAVADDLVDVVQASLQHLLAKDLGQTSLPLRSFRMDEAGAPATDLLRVFSNQSFIVRGPLATPGTLQPSGSVLLRAGRRANSTLDAAVKPRIFAALATADDALRRQQREDVEAPPSVALPSRVTVEGVAAFVRTALKGFSCARGWADPQWIRRAHFGNDSLTEDDLLAHLQPGVDSVSGVATSSNDALALYNELFGSGRFAFVTLQDQVTRVVESKLDIATWLGLVERFYFHFAADGGRVVDVSSGSGSSESEALPVTTGAWAVSLPPDWDPTVGSAVPTSADGAPPPPPQAPPARLLFRTYFTPRALYFDGLATMRKRHFLPSASASAADQASNPMPMAVGREALVDILAARAVASGTDRAGALSSSIQASNPQWRTVAMPPAELLSAANAAAAGTAAKLGRIPILHASAARFISQIDEAQQLLDIITATLETSALDEASTVSVEPTRESASEQGPVEPLSFASWNAPLAVSRGASQALEAAMASLRVPYAGAVHRLLQPPINDAPSSGANTDAESIVAQAALTPTDDAAAQEMAVLEAELSGLTEAMIASEKTAQEAEAAARFAQTSLETLEAVASQQWAEAQGAVAAAERDIAEHQLRLQEELNQLGERLSAQIAVVQAEAAESLAAARSLSIQVRYGDPVQYAMQQRAAALREQEAAAKARRREAALQAEEEHSLVGRWAAVGTPKAVPSSSITPPRVTQQLKSDPAASLAL